MAQRSKQEARRIAGLKVEKTKPIVTAQQAAAAQSAGQPRGLIKPIRRPRGALPGQGIG